MKYFTKEAVSKQQKEDISSGFFAGAAGSAVASLVVSPLDVVNTIQQSEGGKTKDIVKRLYAQEGLSGFYRGLPLKLMKVVPAGAITFGTGMAIKNLMDRKPVEL